MNMKLFGAAIAAGLAIASSAGATVTLLYEPAGNLTYALHNTADDTAPTVRLDVVGEPFLVDLTGSTSLNQGGNGGGFAVVDGTPYFDTLLVDPFNFAGFQAFQFNLAVQTKVLVDGEEENVVSTEGTFRIDYTLIGGGGGFVLADFAQSPNNKFQLVSDAAGLETITLSDLNGFYKVQGNNTATPLDFASIRQMSFEDARGRVGGVPEPATWALMIMGFGGAGAMLRRRRGALA